MKKNIVFLLTILLLASLTVSAGAEAIPHNYEDVGVTLNLPFNLQEDSEDLTGFVVPYPYGAVSHDPDLFLMPMFYFGMDAETVVEAMNSEDLSEEEEAAIRAAQTEICVFITAEGGPDAFREILDLSDCELVEYATLDDLHYYFVTFDAADYLAGLEPQFAEEYEKVLSTLENALQNAEVYLPSDPEAETVGADANDANAYRVQVTSAAGDPIEGVMIQFCDENTCNMAKTDASGTAAFEMPEGIVYTVHVLKVPSGYGKISDEFQTLDVYSDIVIVLPEA
ncbi:MAG: hypothetical protein K6C08_09190 [Oscillospiraceae bacterium]|nr:hypothetical protein [Oscillospiraceae bacterium]